MPMWMQTLEVEGIGRRLQATVRLGWPGEMTVSPKPVDVPLKTKSGQGWSTRWKGDFDEDICHPFTQKRPPKVWGKNSKTHRVSSERERTADSVLRLLSVHMSFAVDVT